METDLSIPFDASLSVRVDHEIRAGHDEPGRLILRCIQSDIYRIICQYFDTHLNENDSERVVGVEPELNVRNELSHSKPRRHKLQKQDL